LSYFQPERLLKKVQEIINDVPGRSVSFTYNSDGQLESFTDARGKTTTYSYVQDDNAVKGYLASITYPEVNTVNIEYDAETKNVVSLQEQGKTDDTEISYVPSTNTTIVEDPSGNQFQFIHDSLSRLTSQQGPDMNEASFEYTSANAPNKPSRVEDKEGNATSFEYDTNGNITQITNAENKISTFYFNDKNNLKWSTRFHSSGDTVPITEYQYDATDNQLEFVTNPEGETIDLVYMNNQLIEVIDGRGYSTDIGYDAYGNLSQIIDAEGNVTDITNDYTGRVIQVIDAEDGMIEYDFDDNNNLTDMDYLAKDHVNIILPVDLTYDDNGNLDSIRWVNNGSSVQTDYDYDNFDRLQTSYDPLDASSVFTYYETDLVHTRRDRNNITTTYLYDENNRLEEIQYPDTGQNVNIQRNKNGSITSISGLNDPSQFTYNTLNKIETYTGPYDKTVQYAYDYAGRLYSITYPGTNKVVTYAYDEAGRLEYVYDWVGGETRYIYDNAGNLEEVRRPNGTKAVYSYDMASRLEGLVEQKSDGTPICSYTYVLDGVGNHRIVTVNEEPLSAVLTAENVSYSYDIANRLQSASGVSYTYDGNGNCTGNSSSGGTTYTWDYENRLTEISQNSPYKNLQYKYDAMGNRIARVEGGTWTKYVLDLTGDMSRVLAETDGSGNITAYYVYGLGLVSRITPAEERKFYHYNNRGDTIALTDGSQDITDSYVYDEFGKLLDSLGSTPNPFKFVGQYGVMDEGDDGLYFMRSRYYNSIGGRFLSEDPLQFNAGDWNIYGYVMMNPLTITDPNGMIAQGNDAGIAMFGNILAGAFNFTVGVGLVGVSGAMAGAAGASTMLNQPVVSSKIAGTTILGMEFINNASINSQLTVENGYRFISGEKARKNDVEKKKGIFGFMHNIFDINTGFHMGAPY